MGATKVNSIIVKSNTLGIKRYTLFADRFLTLEEKKKIEKMTETDFLEMVSKNKWTAHEKKSF